MNSSMQTNASYTKTQKSNKREAYTGKQEKANKPKRDKNIFKQWQA